MKFPIKNGAGPMRRKKCPKITQLEKPGAFARNPQGSPRKGAPLHAHLEPPWRGPREAIRRGKGRSGPQMSYRRRAASSGFGPQNFRSLYLSMPILLHHQPRRNAGARKRMASFYQSPPWWPWLNNRRWSLGHGTSRPMFSGSIMKSLASGERSPRYQFHPRDPRRSWATCA